jgi:ABC-type dipeptide/oligopeptide/nickel transport system ATPase component
VSLAGIRIQLRNLPRQPTECRFTMACPYRVERICDDPSVNKGNSDAGCHKMTNRLVLAALNPQAYGTR